MQDKWLRGIVRNVPDYPQPGINFKDINPLLAHPPALQLVCNTLGMRAQSVSPDVIVTLESRGHFFATPMSLALQLPLVPARKPNKLPGEVVTVEYGLEYGKSVLQMQRDAIRPGQRVFIVDDLLATGGSADAARKLVEMLGGIVVGFGFAIELCFLPGREKLSGAYVTSVLKY